MLDIYQKSMISLVLSQQKTPDKDPDILVRLDQRPEPLTSSHGTELRFDMSASVGQHVLSIMLSNKESSDTVCDANGNIVQDLNLQLKGFFIDEIDFTDYAKLNIKYITEQGIVERTYGFMHRNGVMTLEFSCPGFYFLRNTALIRSEK